MRAGQLAAPSGPTIIGGKSAFSTNGIGICNDEQENGQSDAKMTHAELSRCCRAARQAPASTKVPKLNPEAGQPRLRSPVFVEASKLAASGPEEHQPDDRERYDRQRRARSQEIADRRSSFRLPGLLRALNDLSAALESHWIILFLIVWQRPKRGLVPDKA